MRVRRQLAVIVAFLGVVSTSGCYQRPDGVWVTENIFESILLCPVVACEPNFTLLFL